LTDTITGMIKLLQPLLRQLLGTPHNRSAQPMFAEIVGCFGEVLT